MTSVQPRKQRRLIYKKFTNKDYNKLLSAHLSKELRDKYKRRSLRVRVNDVVRVMRGTYKGFEGKVVKVNPKKGYVYIEGLTRKNARGLSVMIPIHASKVMIVKLYLEDKYRAEKLKVAQT
mgnify:CR=1 FL=1|jgi:LSU ribosomal protein L24P